MKKIVAILLVCVLAIVAFAGCTPNECEVCGKSAKTSKVEIEGETGYACDECKAIIDSVNELADAFGSLG